MNDGGESAAGDPVNEVSNICSSTPWPKPACLFAADAIGVQWSAIHMAQRLPAPGPYPSRFQLSGEPVMRVLNREYKRRDLVTAFSHHGYSLIPGGIEALAQPITDGGVVIDKGLRLPYAQKATPEGLVRASLPWEGIFDRRVVSPVITLLICEAPNAGEGKPSQRCDSFEGLLTKGLSLIHI